MTEAQCRKCDALEFSKDWYITVGCKKDGVVEGVSIDDSLIHGKHCVGFCTNMATRYCHKCGRKLVDFDWEPEYTHCIAYCCGCCPSRNGYREESCHKDYVDRQKGRPVGVMESWPLRGEIVDG